MSTQQTTETKKTKLVKVKIMRDCYATVDGKETLLKPSANPMAPTVVEIPENEAVELCDTKFDAPPKYRGSRPDEDPENKNYITRAVRL